MRRTDFKVDRIKVFIKTNRPTRSELVKYIATELNGIKEDFFDNHKRSFRGYYGTNIQTMRTAGNIASDNNGKYYVTKQGMSDDYSLYQKPYKVQLREMRAWFYNREDWYEKRIKTLKEDNKKLEMKVKELEATMYHINMLSK